MGLNVFRWGQLIRGLRRVVTCTPGHQLQLKLLPAPCCLSHSPGSWTSLVQIWEIQNQQVNTKKILLQGLQGISKWSVWSVVVQRSTPNTCWVNEEADLPEAACNPYKSITCLDALRDKNNFSTNKGESLHHLWLSEMDRLGSRFKLHPPHPHWSNVLYTQPSIQWWAAQPVIGQSKGWRPLFHHFCINIWQRKSKERHT